MSLGFHPCGWTEQAAWFTSSTLSVAWELSYIWEGFPFRHLDIWQSLGKLQIMKGLCPLNIVSMVSCFLFMSDYWCGLLFIWLKDRLLAWAYIYVNKDTCMNVTGAILLQLQLCYRIIYKMDKWNQPKENSTCPQIHFNIFNILEICIHRTMLMHLLK